MLKISHAGCLRLSLAIVSQFTIKMCVAAKNAKKSPPNPSFGGSRSSKVNDVNKTKKPVTRASYGCTICNLFHTKKPIATKYLFNGGTPIRSLRLRETFSPAAQNFVAKK